MRNRLGNMLLGVAASETAGQRILSLNPHARALHICYMLLFWRGTCIARGLTTHTHTPDKPSYLHRQRKHEEDNNKIPPVSRHISHTHIKSASSPKRHHSIQEQKKNKHAHHCTVLPTQFAKYLCAGNCAAKIGGGERLLLFYLSMLRLFFVCFV